MIEKKEFVVKNESGFRMKIRHWKAANPSTLNSVEFVQECMKNGEVDFTSTYHFLMTNFGPEKIDELLNLFGRPFVEYSLNEKRTNIEKLFQVHYIISENTHLLETNTDPIILGMTVFGKIRDLF
jgi:hypothetical protein